VIDVGNPDTGARPVHHRPVEKLSAHHQHPDRHLLAQPRSVAVGDCWPGNRHHDVALARHTIAHLLTGERVILGDSGYRGIDTSTIPACDTTGRIIHDAQYRRHRRVRARVEHVIARLKDWQILRQCRRRGQAITHSLHIIAELWNLKNQSRTGYLADT